MSTVPHQQTIRDAWRVYAEHVIPPGACRCVMLMFELAFYAGAAHGISDAFVISKGASSRNAALDGIGRLADEVLAHTERCQAVATDGDGDASR